MKNQLIFVLSALLFAGQAEARLSSRYQCDAQSSQNGGGIIQYDVLVQPGAGSRNYRVDAEPIFPSECDFPKCDGGLFEFEDFDGRHAWVRSDTSAMMGNMDCLDQNCGMMEFTTDRTTFNCHSSW